MFAKLLDGENSLLQKADRCSVIRFVVESRETCSSLVPGATPWGQSGETWSTCQGFIPAAGPALSTSRSCGAFEQQINIPDSSPEDVHIMTAYCGVNQKGVKDWGNFGIQRTTNQPVVECRRQLPERDLAYVLSPHPGTPNTIERAESIASLLC